MVSAPSVRRKRRAAKRAARVEAQLSAGRPRSPLLIAVAALVGLVLLIGGAMAVRSWLADPWARGRESMARFEWASARVDLLNAVNEAPRALPRRLALVETLLAMGRGREAENQLRRAIELGLSAEAARASLARALALQGRDEEALAELAVGPIAARDGALAARTAGEVNYRLGNFSAASEAFAALVRDYPRDSGGWQSFAIWRLSEQDMLGADNAADMARRLAPRDVRAHLAKAMVVRARAGPVAALPWFEAALDVDRRDVATLAEYAATLGEAGRYEAMMEPLRAAATVAPDNSRILFLEATIAARGGESALARGLLQRINGPDADLPAVLLLRATVEMMLDAPAVATGFAERVVARQPDNGTARRLLASAQLAAGNPRGAIMTLDPITTRPDADSWSLVALGRAFGAIGWQEDAINPLERARTLRPGNASALRAPVPTGNALDPAVAVPAIRAAIASGNAGEAQTLARSLVAANPGVPQAALLLGDAEAASGDLAAATATYRRAAELRFDEPAMLRLVNLLLRRGQREAAGEVLIDFMARNPESVPPMRIAAAMAAENGVWDGALAYLQAIAARIGPNDALLQAQIARAHVELGDADAAIPYAARAYRLLPGNATIAGVYGLALLRADRRTPDPMELLKKAVELAPDDVVLARWMAEAQAR